MNFIERRKVSFIERVLRCHDELEVWCETFSGDTIPQPTVFISGYYVGLSIGEIEIWDTESGYYDDVDRVEDTSPTFAGSVECYKNLIKNLSFWKPEEEKS
jgi:hypothetical protein